MVRLTVEQDGKDGPYYIWIRDDDVLPDLSVKYFIRNPDEAWELIDGLLDYLEDYYYEHDSDEGLELVRRVRRIMEGETVDT